MSPDTTSIFLYLEKEEISIDKTEYEFQIQSHPDSPSLLAISDTLNFFNVETFIAKVGFEELENLPNQFIAHLNTELSDPQLYFIEKKENQFYCNIDKNLVGITRNELEERWTGIILVIEKSEDLELFKQNKSYWFLILQVLFFTLFIIAVSKFQVAYTSKLFFIFPTVGLLLSIAVLKDLFGIKSKLVNNFCNMTAYTSCAAVVESTRWKIFEIVNFSDLSFMFFASQFIGLLLFLFSHDTISYFIMQKGVLVCSTPVLLLSLYYQKNVEKKWCPICLGIITVVLLELCYIYVFKNYVMVVSISSALIFGLVFVSMMIIWLSLKKLLTQRKELLEFKLKSTRFIRNYEVFKNSLLASDKTNYHTLPAGNLIIGNKNANLKIMIISNPFCSHCAEAHILIEEILKKHKDNICIDMRFNFDETNNNNNNNQFEKVHQKLVRIYYDYGQEVFMKSLQNWFENKDDSRLIVSENSVISDLKIGEILHGQFLMNKANNISFTPTIIIDQYIFPKIYDRKELIYFIHDLLEDEEFFEIKSIGEGHFERV